MSEWGDALAVIEAEVRAAIPELAPGDDGFERGIRIGETLSTGQLPHVFAHSPTEQATELERHQEQVEFTWQLDLWTRGETQEQVALKLDAIRDRIRANRTLSGTVDFALLSTRAVVEAAVGERTERAGVLIVRMRRVD